MEKKSSLSVQNYGLDLFIWWETVDNPELGGWRLWKPLLEKTWI